MPKITPIAHSEFVKRLRLFGYSGPFAGGKHLFMTKEQKRIIIPNPHSGDIGIDLLVKILRQAGITKNEWCNA